MIDIHAHILPNIDDGPKDESLALAILQKAEEQGVTEIVLTSHYYGKKSTPERFAEKRAEAFEKIKASVPEKIRLRLGAEVHFSGVNVPKAEALEFFAIEGTKYVLLELPFLCRWSQAMSERIAEFIADTGYVPILAHVERYKELRKNPQLITELVNLGCLLQVNTGAFLDRKQKSFAFALLKKGFVHCIGSDVHDMEKRCYNYTEAKAAVEKAGFSQEWQEIQENMRRLLDGEIAHAVCGKSVKKFLWWYF